MAVDNFELWKGEEKGEGGEGKERGMESIMAKCEEASSSQQRYVMGPIMITRGLQI